MLTFNTRVAALCLVTSIAIAPGARAQWAVVDVGAITQLMQQVQAMQQQLATARGQLQSAQQALQAMTGNRGMEGLLGDTPRNYLPTDWTQVTRALQRPGSGGYAGLSADVHAAIAANAVLSPQRLATLSSSDRQQIQAARQWGALQQALARGVLETHTVERVRRQHRCVVNRHAFRVDVFRDDGNHRGLLARQAYAGHGVFEEFAELRGACERANR